MPDNTLPIVYVVQEQQRLDYADAERFGEVRFLTHLEYNGLRNSIRNKQVTASIAIGLIGFDPSKDYLLMTGSPVAMGYAFWIAMLKASAVGCSKLNILQWDRESSHYKHIVFEE
jgi:hypothetical protein